MLVGNLFVSAIALAIFLWLQVNVRMNICAKTIFIIILKTNNVIYIHQHVNINICTCMIFVDLIVSEIENARIAVTLPCPVLKFPGN